MVNIMHLTIMRFDHMTSGDTCKVKDDLVNQLITLNNKLNTLSPDLLHSEQKCKNEEKAYTLKSSSIGPRDTKANLVRPLSACHTVQVSSKVVHFLINGS
jgi:hypothetical protein